MTDQIKDEPREKKNLLDELDFMDGAVAGGTVIMSLAARAVSPALIGLGSIVFRKHKEIIDAIPEEWKTEFTNYLAAVKAGYEEFEAELRELRKEAADKRGGDQPPAAS